MNNIMHKVLPNETRYFRKIVIFKRMTLFTFSYRRYLFIVRFQCQKYNIYYWVQIHKILDIFKNGFLDIFTYFYPVAKIGDKNFTLKCLNGANTMS